jgi:hypothetical protein
LRAFSCKIVILSGADSLPVVPLIERGTTVEGTPVPRSLYGDDKIRVAAREGKEIARRVDALLATIVKARFDDEAPDNRTVREAVYALKDCWRDLRNIVEDLRLYTEVTTDGPPTSTDE